MKKAIIKKTKKYKFSLTLNKGTEVFITEISGKLFAKIGIDDVMNYPVQEKDFEYKENFDKKEIKRLKKQIASVGTKLTMLAIPENALLDGVVRLLKENVSFNDATDNKEEIYQGDIFEQILSERVLINEKLGTDSNKVMLQLEALAELVSQDYVLITHG